MKYNAPFGSVDPDAPYVDRDTPGAVSGSKVPASAVEFVQREIVAIIAAAGFTPSNADLSQLAKAVQSHKMNFATATGTANAIIVALSPAPLDYYDGMPVRFRPSATNAGATTINVNGLGAIPVKRPDGNPCVGGEFLAGIPTEVTIDATNSLAIISAGIALVHGIQVFTASGTFTVPAGVTTVKATVVGGGGGGANCSPTIVTPGSSLSSGGGGGAGALAVGSYSVTPGQTVPVIVGTGGASQSNGGSSSFGAFCSASGGGGTQFQTSSTSAGGVGGTASGGNILNSPGGFGSDGQSNSFTGMGNGAPGPWGGAGRAYAGGASATPANAHGYGAGGGGTYAAAAGANAGGTGGPGVVIVEW
jgi:hypothetical protein